MQRHVLFFGDSIVLGVGDPRGSGWVGRVVSAANQNDSIVVASNLGVRRETSEEVVARLVAETTPRIYPGQKTSVVFSFGSNDTTLEEGEVRVYPDASLAALRDGITASRRLGLEVFVVGPAPVNDDDQIDRIVALSDAFAAECAALDVPFVAIAEQLRVSPAWTSEQFNGDGAHPGAAGYDELAAILLSTALPTWLREF